MNILPAETRMNSSMNVICPISRFALKIHKNKDFSKIFPEYQENIKIMTK